MRRRDAREREKALEKAKILTEALPWIHKHNGQTVVVKYGGAAMEDAELMQQVVADLELLKLMGMRVVLVHGGGKAINKLLESLSLPAVFKDGLRVTDDATMEAVQMVLVGKVNQQLVWALNEYGNNAVGLSGADGKTFKCKQVDPELGRVGTITKVNTHLIESILDDGYVPVIATVGSGPDGFYNINADVAASQVAQALGAETLIYLTDVDGFYREFGDDDSLIANMTKAEAHELLEGGTLATGMIPKIRSIVEALDSGVRDVRILNGTFPHSLLLEIFTDAGIGTMFTQGDE
ncbi:MAG: acetylglutamate kinase [Atopobiaceae bacterium]|nr:acetylglutamate kinase [Atopobiaceae bacterium]MDO4404371.1 acetylglutamate kinase [Atopobiaceae bacterium]